MIAYLVITASPETFIKLYSIITACYDDFQLSAYVRDMEAAGILLGRLRYGIVFIDWQTLTQCDMQLRQLLKISTIEVVALSQYSANKYVDSTWECTSHISISSSNEAMLDSLNNIREKVLRSDWQGISKYRNSNILHLYYDDFRKLSIPTLDGMVFLNRQDILYCEAVGKYTRFFLADRTTLTSSTNIGEYENLLKLFGFLRIHHHYLVNLSCITRYIKGRGGYVIMCNGAKLTVAVRKKDELLHRFIS